MKIGKYDVVGQVGAGSTGVVWLATQPEVDRRVAIKQLAPALATDASFRDRFRAEARVLASLSTPNVVAIYDYVEAPDGAYIVEEYVDGASLARVVTEAGRLRPEQAVGVTRGALRGLADAHDVDLVHGDVTPANILVAQDGTSKLIDFGLSVSSGSTGSSGTPAYASPEAIAGHPLDARSDVYSAGCVLFELLAGEAPFRGGPPTEIAVRPTEAQPPALPGTHTGLAGVVGRAMANDPAARYPNAREFLAALEDEARHDLGAGWELTASIAGLTLAATLTTAAVTGSTNTGGVASPPVTTTATAPIDPASQRTAARRIPRAALAVGAAVLVVIIGIAIAVAVGSGGSKSTGTSASTGGSPAAGGSGGHVPRAGVYQAMVTLTAIRWDPADPNRTPPVAIGTTTPRPVVLTGTCDGKGPCRFTNLSQINGKPETVNGTPTGSGYAIDEHHAGGAGCSVPFTSHVEVHLGGTASAPTFTGAASSTPGHGTDASGAPCFNIGNQETITATRLGFATPATPST